MKIALSLFLVCLGFIVAHEGHEHVARKLGGGSRETMIQRECWTREPEEPDFEARRRARSFANFRREQGAESSDLASLDTRIIPVCFHNPGGVRLPLLNRLSLWNERMLTNEQLQRELDHLNEAFTASSCCDESLPWCDGQCSVDIPIKFVMARVDSDDNIIGTTDTTSDSDACITRPQGLRWMRMAVLGFSEARIKSALRVGDASTLNIYFIRSSLAPLGRTQLLGFATFPWSYSRRPKLDGVVVEPASVGGGSFERFDEGDTLVHGEPAHML